MTWSTNGVSLASEGTLMDTEMQRPLWAQFFKENPYVGFPLEKYEVDIQGWGAGPEGVHPIFEDVLGRLKPRLIIEVGTWKGHSALNMASLMDKLGLPGHIVCVDTFLGSPDHYLSEELYDLMKVKNGFPSLYPQFLANVLLSGQQERIVPFPMTSDGAARLMKKRGIVADLIYVDGDHEYEVVSRDLANYWQLLRPGGVILGDDYDEASWPGVVRAAHEFTSSRNLKLFTGDGKYIIHA